MDSWFRWPDRDVPVLLDAAMLESHSLRMARVAEMETLNLWYYWLRTRGIQHPEYWHRIGLIKPGWLPEVVK